MANLYPLALYYPPPVDTKYPFFKSADQEFSYFWMPGILEIKKYANKNINLR